MADPVIVEMLQGADKADGRVVSTVDEILGRLVATGQARKMRIPPRLVGVHPKNRNGCGVSAVEVHAHWGKIVFMGYTTVGQNPVCIEDDDSKSIALFTNELQQKTAGLGVVDIDTIKYGSLSNSHTNQFLVALDLEVESDEPLLTVEGRMNKSKVSVDKKLMDAVENGLTWLVLSSSVAKLYPTLPDLVQWARNFVGTTQQAESNIGLLAKIQAHK